jgi:enamine deaminase RidA (YjgF/YER057c/UK114 family)
MSIADRLVELDIRLPPVFAPAGSYEGCVLDGNILYVSGHGPISGSDFVRGKVGHTLTIAEAKRAARLTGLSMLATMQQTLGTLDRVERITKLFGMVNVAEGFDQTPAVIDGCSELLIEVFGDAGRHARSAVGMAELPFGIAVEIELIARVHD